MIILGTNSIKDTGYNVANSVRFNRSDDSYMSRTFGTPTNRKKFTISFWLKRSNITISNGMALFGSDGGNTSTFGTIHFNPQDDLAIQAANGSSDILNLVTDRKFRDCGSWYHICVIFDTTQSTNTDRVKLYVNGTQETSFSSNTYPDQNEEFLFNMGTKVHSIGKFPYGADVLSIDGYLAEFVFIDGTTTSITDFGEFDEDSPTIWKPKDVSELTFGNNGCYLDFEDSGDLGDDESGNGNDFTETNVAATDQTTDTCTNNFATWNSLVSSNGTLSEGNVKYATSNSSSNYGYRLSTIGVSSGMWYAEVKYTSSSNQALIGIRSREATAVSHYLGYYDDDYAIYVDGHYYNNNSETTNANASWTSGDIIGIYLDLDNNKLYFSKNGALYSSTGISITAAASTTTGFYFFSASEWNSSGNGTFELNTGNPSFTLSSAVNDGDYGSFEYSTTITGDGASKTFKALCTKNLAEFG